MTHASRRLQRLGNGRVRAPLPSPQEWAATAAARGLVAALVGVQVVSVMGGVVGVGAGAGVGLLLHRWLRRLEPSAVRRRRARVQADLPLAVDLLVVCLRAGRPVGAAMSVVAAALSGPLGADLSRWAARLELGGEPGSVWAEVAADPVLGPVGRAVVRALDTGAPVADSLDHLGEDLRRDRVVDADEMSRRVAVRSAGPLGLCFLPAFVLIGVAPTVIGAFSTLLA